MKNIFAITAILLSIHSFGQTIAEKNIDLKNSNAGSISQNDTTIKVVYKNNTPNENRPVFFLNGKYLDQSFARSVNPKDITNLYVEEGIFETDNINYNWKVLIETKDEFKPKFISLNDLKLKYTNLKENSTIFRIDDEIVDDDYEKCLIDENNILEIVVEKLENQKEKLKINIVSLLTKSEKNIRKQEEKSRESKKIMIRGSDHFRNRWGKTLVEYSALVILN